MNKEKVSVDLINKLANYGLLQSLAKQDAEISYVERI